MTAGKWLYRYLLLMACLGTGIASAQHPLKLSIEPTGDYLPTTVFYVFRDAADIMWLATNTGVYRYNGYTFEHFTSEDGLGDNEILRLYQDKKGRIWFQSMNGNPSYYLQGKIYHKGNDSMLAQLTFTKMILSEVENADGDLYINARPNNLVKITPDNKVEYLQISGFENYMWVDNAGKLYTLSRNVLTKNYPIRGNRKGNLNLVSQLRDVYRINSPNDIELLFTLPAISEEIIFMRIKTPEEVYIGTRNGLFIWNSVTEAPLQHLMEGYSISSVDWDFEDNLWLSTLESGAFMIPNQDVIIWDANNGLPESKVTCLEHDHTGALWIGMSSDYYASLDTSGVFTLYRMPKQSRLDITNIREQEGMMYIIGKSDIVRKSESGNFYFGIYGNDVLLSDLNGVFVAQDYTLHMNRDQFENEVSDIVFNFKQRRTDFELLQARTNVVKENNGTVYIGTSRGLYSYSNNTLQYWGAVNKAFTYPVRDLTFDRNTGRVYLATMNGLLVFNNGVLEKQFSTMNGLPNSDCNAVFVDDKNTLWAAFGNKIVSLRRTGDNYTIKNFSHLLKIIATRITDIESYKGRMYISTETGLISFDPTAKNVFTTPPLLQFGELSVNNRRVDINELQDLKHGENDISISYTGTSYLSGNSITYSYYLSGYDAEWHSTTERNIQYKSLPSGNYRFLVKATNAAGITSEVQAIPIFIRKPVWKEWWFMGITLLWISGMLAIVWRIRLRSLKRNFAQEQRTIRLEKEKAESDRLISELNQQAFRQQMNPHFIFNALNTIKGYYAENNIKEASEYISKFSRLLRTILENSEQVIPLEKEITALTLYMDLAAMRYEHKFDYSIQVDSGLHIHDVAIPPMLIQPFVENAIVHGIAPLMYKGHIQILFSAQNDRLICVIRDNGIGRSAAAGKTRLKEHTSKATLLITEYLRALNTRNKSEAFTLGIRDQFDEDGKPIGTEVEISMPLMFM